MWRTLNLDASSIGSVQGQYDCPERLIARHIMKTPVDY